MNYVFHNRSYLLPTNGCVFCLLSIEVELDISFCGFLALPCALSYSSAFKLFSLSINKLYSDQEDMGIGGENINWDSMEHREMGLSYIRTLLGVLVGKNETRML